MKRTILITAFSLGSLIHAGCDITSPPPASVVVQMFVESDSLLAPLMLHETFQPATTTALPITDAEVGVRLDGSPISYHHNPLNPGMYEPREPLRVRAGSAVDVSINYDAGQISASTILPPKLKIDSASAF